MKLKITIENQKIIKTPTKVKEDRRAIFTKCLIDEIV